MPTDNGGIAATLEIARRDHAEQRAVVLELARLLDVHDAEHVGAWGHASDDCIWC